MHFLGLATRAKYFQHSKLVEFLKAEYELHKVQPLTVPLTDLDALTLSYCLSKFVQEVANYSFVHIQNSLSSLVFEIKILKNLLS